LFDASCVSCGGAIDTRVDARAVLCRRCVRTLSPPTRIRTPDGLEECRVLCDYDGVGRDLVVALKFRGRHAAVPWLADRLAELAGDMGVQVVTWAPTSRSRRRSRGFDQAELLARRVARRLIVPWRRCLVRLPGPAQTGRDRAAR